MISIQVTNKPSDIEYLTVAECLRRNGYRHYLNGMKYLEQGLTHHARGSFTKAQRNYWRSEVLGDDNHYLNDICAPMFDWFNKEIAETIMSQKVAGTLFYMNNDELILRTVTEQEMYKDG